MSIQTERDVADPSDLTRTRPGTPMIGVYSTNQMDDFYTAISHGEVKPSGIMNLYQHLYIAERCQPGSTVLDVCCGRGLALPLLSRYAPQISGYIGLDISPDNLAEARAREADLKLVYGRGFGVELIECDVAASWPTTLPPIDAAIYTSALEHLPFELGKASLLNTASALAPGGTLYLSTPNTLGDPPRPLQHRVHVYEWSMEEVLEVLEAAELEVAEIIGILPPPTTDELTSELERQFGEGAVDWYHALAGKVPAALLDTISATCVGRVATEILYVARRAK